MNPQQLRYLRAIVVGGSFDAAARACGVSQSAVTQAIQALEREWGCALFERSGRRKLPTPAALAAVQQVGQVLDSLDALMRKGAQRAAPPARKLVLRVGMAPAAALLYATLIQSTWAATAPNALLQIVSGGTAPLLQAFQVGELDLLIGPRPRGAAAPGSHQHLLHQSMLSVCARADHPLARATTLAQLGCVAWAVAGAEGTPGAAVEEAHRVRKLGRPRVVVECADYNLLLHLVANSDLMCMVPHPALLRGREALGVELLKLTEGLPLYEVFLYWRASATGPRSTPLLRVVDALTAASAPSTRDG